MSSLVLVIIILVVLVMIAAGVAFVLNQEARRKRRVMAIIQRGERQDKGHDKDDPNKRRADLAKKLKESEEEEKAAKGKDGKKVTLSMMIEQAGLSISNKQYWLFSFLCMGGAVVIAKMMGQSSVVLVMAAVIGLLGVPRLVLKKLAQKRQKDFLEEFPDALEATVRLLKAGMPVSEAVLMISKEYEGPVGEEMSRVYDKQKIGVPMHEAAFEATRRMPLPEMKMFATGLAIQAQTGASLSEVLMNLAAVIRARFRLKRKVKALSSEAIVSAGIIGSLPNFVAVSLYFVNREYIEILFTDPFGKVLLAGAIIWMCIGIFIMRAMINFKV